jgi:hypothetical protein
MASADLFDENFGLSQERCRQAAERAAQSSLEIQNSERKGTRRL